MGKRKWFLVSVALILCAICIDLVAKYFDSRSLSVTAKSIADKSASEADIVAAGTESNKLGRIGDILRLVSLGLAVLGAAAWYMAMRLGEPVWHLLLLGLFVAFGLLQLVMT
jgi:hypothetical protein